MGDTPQSQFPTMSTQLIRDFFGPAPEVRARAMLVMRHRYEQQIQGLVRSKVRGRHVQITGDVVQEAWLRCLDALDEHRPELLKPRPERPDTSQLLVTHAKRAINTLVKREQRAFARHVTTADAEPPSEGAGADNSTLDTPIGPVELHRVIEEAWQRLLEQTREADRVVLSSIGIVTFFVGEWEAAAKCAAGDDTPAVAMTQLVVERRRVIRALLRAKFAKYQLTRNQAQNLVCRLLPTTAVEPE
jgi:DNA-directed RNA polymerase specialized sigma24 family protein